MTRDEFIYNVTSWPELLSFCYDYDCDVCADIVSNDDLQPNITEDFRVFGDRYSWTDIRGWLNDIDDSAEYYYRNGSFEYESVDDDFDSWKDEVLSWGDDGDIWEQDDDVDLDLESELDLDFDIPDIDYEKVDLGIVIKPSTEQECDVPDEDFTVADLFGSCNTTFHEICGTSK